MTTWDPKANHLFLQAQELRSAGERRAFLDEACAGNAALRAEVESLLEASIRAGSFLESPAFAPHLAATTDEPIRERPGTAIGPYKLLEQIGEGGFGVVFMAEQTQPVRRRVALKVLKPGMDTRQVVARFEAERQALAIMDHPHIAHVFDGGETAAGRPYFVMELVRGVPITDFCDQNRLSVRERLDLFANVCQAVQHAHQKGIIHRDLKPSNVLVSRHDTTPIVKVIDFGVAKSLGQELTDKTLFTGLAQMIGTPLYMSPEQAGMSDLDIDTRSDIYSLGVLLYELLTGTTPFDKERLRSADYDELRRIIREEEPAKPSTRISTLEQTAIAVSTQRQSEPKRLSQLFRGELDWIVMKALDKDRNRRYETVSDFAADVQRYLNDEPVVACPPSAWYRFRKIARRNRPALITVSAFILAAVIGVGALVVSTVLVWKANKDLRDALTEREEAFDRERREAYFQRITVAHRELTDNPAAALRALRECPEDLRGWEWHYLKRLSRIEPLVLQNKIEVTSVAFSPDSEHLASAGGDGAVKIWNSRTGKVALEFRAHDNSAVSIAFHLDGKHLASAGADGWVKVWALTTGQEAQEVFRCPRDVIMRKFGSADAVAFRPPDGRQLAFGSNGAVKIWDWMDCQALHTFSGFEHHSISVAFSRDGRRLATGSWLESPRLWDSTTGEGPLLTLPGHRHPISALTFSPDGGRLASASLDRSVKVWDTTTGKCLDTLLHPGTVMHVAYSPDGRRLASAGEDKTVHVWDAETGWEVLSLRGHTGTCGCLAYSPDGQRLASASADGTIRIWDATPLREDEGPRHLNFTGHDDEIRGMAFSPDGRWIASADFRGNVKVWDAETGRMRVCFKGDSVVIFGLAWHPDGRRLASAGSDGRQQTVKVWDARTGQLIFQLPHGPEIVAVAFRPDGRYMVTGRVNGALQVWDAKSGDEVGTLGTHEGEARPVVFSPDSKHLASATPDVHGQVKLWDATRLNEKQKARLTLPARIPKPSVNVAFSPDGRRLATGGERNTIEIRDVQTGRELQTLWGHSGEVYAVAFSSDGRWIASGGEDSAVKIWDSHNGEVVRTFRGHTGLVISVAFSPDGRRLASGSRDKTVKVWDLTPLSEVPED